MRNPTRARHPIRLTA